MNDDLPGFVPASAMDDAELRRELAEVHRLAEALSVGASPELQAALRRRCDALDAEYLDRFPSARSTWPWPIATREPAAV